MLVMFYRIDLQLSAEMFYKDLNVQNKSEQSNVTSGMLLMKKRTSMHLTNREK